MFKFKSPIEAILVKDPQLGGYTAFFAQFPNIISEGETEEDAMTNLLSLMKKVFEHQKAEQLEKTSKTIDGENLITTRSFDLELEMV